MHAIVRGRVSNNADYHTQMAEYYAGFQNESRSAKTPPAPPAGEGNGKRTRGAAPPAPTQQCPYNDEQLAKLVEMHNGAAAQLNAIVANEKPQQILAERALRPVSRQAGARSLRIH